MVLRYGTVLLHSIDKNKKKTDVEPLLLSQNYRTMFHVDFINTHF